MNIRPLQDRILVQPIREKEVRKGGIIIPDSAKDAPTEGRVKAVGPGRVGEDGKRVKPDVKIGDKVLYSKYGGTEVKIDNEDFLLMREDDILGVIDSK
jgi:chaperonin GroES